MSVRLKPDTTDVMVAPESGSPVTSETTCPATTPSATTRSERVAVATLPARSVATAVTAIVSPTLADAGTVSSTFTGAVDDVLTVAPSTDVTTCAKPRLSVADTVAVAPARRAIVAGESMLTTGGVASRVTTTSACDARPSESAAVATRWLSPSTSGTVAVNVPTDSAAVTPFTDTDASVGSDAVPVTAIVDALVSVPGVGDEMDTTGAPKSIVTKRVTVCVLPAASVATTVSVCGPSPRPETLAVHASCARDAAVPLTVTPTAVRSYTKPDTAIVPPPSTAPAAGDSTVSVGGVWSSVTCTSRDETLPARSVAVSVTVFAPSAPLSVATVEKAPLFVGTSSAPIASVTGDASLTVPSICSAVCLVADS